MLADGKIDKKKFWAEAASTANYVQNRCPTIVLDNKTQYEAL